ncbi:MULTISPECIES: hypothetical protein [Winogradskyella]|uniref:hypothetical protein n=1 Tax=Winogradskyella TaxID=286104 RepID=UPI0015C73009|nr:MULTISPECIES: hypothetical protein [Winogradskyella]QXP78758.1 hypothetical protein H0I32_16375 [Winogradskyella sp. HaHa_3_26]
MKFKGGAIIIGSLLWDNEAKRIKWRKLYLESLENRISLKVRIRYGRESISRSNTHTMILSNHPKTEFGNAYILPFKEILKNAKNLESQAFAMAAAEGLWKKTGSSLNKNWGTVGLLINPKLEESRNLEIIKERWTKIYSEYNFNPNDYTIEKEPEIIDKNGFLKIEWTDEMNEFDFLIATLTVPNPKSLLNEQIIADRINETGYDEYFLNNYKNGIRTFQDEEIINKLNKKPVANTV